MRKILTFFLFLGVSANLLATDLMLYYAPWCPYSQKVLRYLDEIHKTVPMKNVSESSKYKKELQKIGGKSQVPCLIIDGKALYESDAIIRWLSENQRELNL